MGPFSFGFLIMSCFMQLMTQVEVGYVVFLLVEINYPFKDRIVRYRCLVHIGTINLENIYSLQFQRVQERFMHPFDSFGLVDSSQ